MGDARALTARKSTRSWYSLFDIIVLSLRVPVRVDHARSGTSSEGVGGQMAEYGFVASVDAARSSASPASPRAKSSIHSDVMSCLLRATSTVAGRAWLGT